MGGCLHVAQHVTLRGGNWYKTYTRKLPPLFITHFITTNPPQIISPIIGKLSDEHRSPWGRRRPFMFTGTLITAVGVIGLSYTSGQRMIFMYAVALFISQVLGDGAWLNLILL